MPHDDTTTDTSNTANATTPEPSVQDILDAAHRSAHGQAPQETIDAVLGAGLVPVDLTISATLRPKPGTELPGQPRRQLLSVEVTSTRALGTNPLVADAEAGETPHLQVRGLVRELKVDGTPAGNRREQWTHLPGVMAASLLGTALTG